jgi:hypothetical protein
MLESAQRFGKVYTFKFEGLTEEDASTPYFYGSLPAKPELGHILIFGETGNRYVIYRIDGEGLTGGEARENERELAWAEISSGASVASIWLQKIGNMQTPASGRAFSAEEVKTYSQKNRETRLAASAE